MWPARDTLSFEPKLTTRCGDVAAEQVGEGGFARAIGADHCVQLVFVQRQRDIVDRQQAAVAFTQTLGLQQGLIHLASAFCVTSPSSPAVPR